MYSIAFKVYMFISLTYYITVLWKSYFFYKYNYLVHTLLSFLLKTTPTWQSSKDQGSTISADPHTAHVISMIAAHLSRFHLMKVFILIFQ